MTSIILMRQEKNNVNLILKIFLRNKKYSQNKAEYNKFSLFNLQLNKFEYDLFILNQKILSIHLGIIQK